MVKKREKRIALLTKALSCARKQRARGRERGAWSEQGTSVMENWETMGSRLCTNHKVHKLFLNGDDSLENQVTVTSYRAQFLSYRNA